MVYFLAHKHEFIKVILKVMSFKDNEEQLKPMVLILVSLSTLKSESTYMFQCIFSIFIREGCKTHWKKLHLINLLRIQFLCVSLASGVSCVTP